MESDDMFVLLHTILRPLKKTDHTRKYEM